MKQQISWNFHNSYLSLPANFYANVALNPVSNPQIVALNPSLAESLGLQKEALNSKEMVAIFAGNIMPDDAAQIAQSYAGHQFGNFTMLGDGRAILIGEHITPNGERFDIQLKGAGRTPYSRGGDGRAGLAPMLRELIISEAMHALHIPTTRSLAVVTTGDPVYRETALEGAVLTRVASSHIRVGTFQFAATYCTEQELRELADYVIDRHYPHIAEKENRYLALLDEVMERQASLIASWQLVGFIHGVMNTDNMTLSGETIDYGPCAFMDTFDSRTVFSSIDVQGRYSYENQPYIGGWNLARFAESLLPLIHDDHEQAISLAQGALANYQNYFDIFWLAGMREKLGLLTAEQGDASLADEWLQLLADFEVDYTNSFRLLADGERTSNDLFNSKRFKEWEQKWLARLEQQDTTVEEAMEVMKTVNPAVIPRNHRVEEVLEAAVAGDFSKLEKLMQVLQQPFDLAEEDADFAHPPEKDAGPFVTYCGT